ncbi:hypothetical protein GA0061078_0404 [Bifidobacterium bohemicum]|uniref:Uncharacterized protein n=1 Tax=Bifidobacterium bohemicum DSM 22767 TaxID=1437606 RepID=A0A086ZJF1_9BIFI|nr:hypothetical protein [Bifidobacterium bohemicum]KFI46651.1 hypothetical protein BBOH_0123 [Bifidobacterium bohemicum DSM 22767]SCB77778.1 hypothetical protein GA0061078_0404 [Bifidobacterium bohemicum]
MDKRHADSDPNKTVRYLIAVVVLLLALMALMLLLDSDDGQERMPITALVVIDMSMLVIVGVLSAINGAMAASRTSGLAHQNSPARRTRTDVVADDGDDGDDGGQTHGDSMHRRPRPTGSIKN